MNKEELILTEEIKFDIIVPIYRTNLNYLKECIASIEGQIHENFVCYLVDGTPLDYEESTEITDLCMEYVTKDDRFNYIIQSGKGVSQARNQGIEAGDSTYVAFLDSDDYWYSERLEWMADSIKNNKKSDTVIWWSVCNTDHIVQSAKTGEIHHLSGHMGLFPDFEQCLPEHHYWFAMGHPLMTSAVVLLRERFEAVGGFDEQLQMAEDTDCWLRMLGRPYEDEKTYLLSYEPDLAGYYRCHPDQTTRLGKQTSAYQSNESGSIEDSRAAHEVFHQQAQEHLTNRHEFPVLENKPDHVTEEYWHWLCDTSGGMNRKQLIFGNEEIETFQPHKSHWV